MKLKIITALLSVSIWACGSDPKQESIEDESSGTYGTTAGGVQSDEDEVTIPVTVAENGQGFNLLATVEAWSVTVDGCASGFTTTVTETNGGVKVFKFDQGCLAKLTTFTADSVVYTPKVGSEFTTWLANDTAVFEGGGNEVYVRVVQQLPDPINSTDAVSYIFSSIVDGGASNVLEADTGNSHTISIAGQDPPSYAVGLIQYVGMTATGAGQFVFRLDCTEAMVGSVCKGVDVSDITYKLVDDTYSSLLTIGDASTIFATAGSAAASTHATGNGGINTITLDGPDQMASNPNMILILEANGLSYQYFNIDVSSLTQP